MSIYATISSTISKTISGTIGFGQSYFKLGRVIDLFTKITRSDTTIADQSGNGLDATLLSGRYPTLDAAQDAITYATDYASASRTATVMMRVTSLGNRTLGAFTFSPSAINVWELLTASATIAGNIAWEAGSDCDISDLRIYEDGVEVDRWIHAELETGDPDGLPVANSIRPLATGTYRGGSFSSGEPTILQTAAMNFNERMLFGDSYVVLENTGTGAAKAIDLNDSFEISFDFIAAESESAYLINNYQSPGGNHLLIHIDPSGSGVSIEFSVDDDVNPTAGESGELALGVKYSCRLVRDKGATVKLFVNSAEVVSATDITTGSVLSDKPWTFGARAENTVSERFHGLLWNIKFYDNSGTLIHSYAGDGATNAAWVDHTGDADGTVGGSPSALLVPVSDTDPTLDAYGVPLTFLRTPKTLNLTDGASAQIAAPVPDPIKTVANWIWHDGRAKTHIDGGNWTVGSTTTALTSTGFTGAAYFVNGVSGTTLSAGWNHVMVASTAELTTADIDFTNVQAHFLAYPTMEVADTALQNFNATKSEYGL